MNKVVVIGGDHHNTLGVLRGLGEREILSDLILVTPSRMTFVDASKYIARQWKIRDNEEIVDTLLTHYKDEDEKPVVICCSDSSSGVIDENHDFLEPYFYLPGSDQQGQISELMSKKEMANLAIEVGLKIPGTTYVTDVEADISKIKLPCIIKPMVSRKGKKAEIAICRTQEELHQYAASHNINNDQIQDFIDKEFEYQLIGCSTKSEIVIPGVSKILRPCKGSNTSYLHYTPLEDGFCEIENCKEFVRRTGYHGLFSLEFLRDKDGQDYFMEINFRNDGNAICVTAAGMSLPYIWYLDCIGKDYSKESKKKISPVYVMPDMAELKLLATRQISLLDYISDFRKTTRFMEYDRKDKKPFWKLVKFHICKRLGF
jgi:predicted ATP-grasp superfamily ATP-dependent carboligase